MELRMAGLKAAFDFWTVKHPAIHSFKFEDHSTIGSWNVAVSSVVLYLLAVFLLKFLLGYREKPVRLGYVPVVHNLVLAVGSLVMFAGCLNAAVAEVQSSSWLWGKRHGAEWVLCFPKGTRAAGPVFFWSYVYYLSKFYELLDTVILLCKKRPLSFLHVFHHATVVFMCFFWLQDTQSLQIIALLTNTAVHVIMYTYYFLCSVNCPPPWKKVVTNVQIVQFVFSFVCGVATLWLHFSGPGCAGMYAFCFNLVFNASLLFLFLNFHSKQYGSGKASKGSTAGRTRRSLQARKQK
jgi:hypothetical protein